MCCLITALATLMNNRLGWKKIPPVISVSLCNLSMSKDIWHLPKKITSSIPAGIKSWSFHKLMTILVPTFDQKPHCFSDDTFFALRLASRCSIILPHYAVKQYRILCYRDVATCDHCRFTLVPCDPWCRCSFSYTLYSCFRFFIKGDKWSGCFNEPWRTCKKIKRDIIP